MRHTSLTYLETLSVKFLLLTASSSTGKHALFSYYQSSVYQLFVVVFWPYSVHWFYDYSPPVYLWGSEQNRVDWRRTEVRAYYGMGIYFS